MTYAIITENDESNWRDKTGELYHHPKRYLKYLPTGTKIIYYKGALKNKAFKNHRLIEYPHYFGIGTIGKQYLDPSSPKDDYFSEIENFRRFERPVLIKHNKHYLEDIPDNLKTNYWRNGVRPITKEVYDRITTLAEINYEDIPSVVDSFVRDSQEGSKKYIYTTRYERDPLLREQAIKIHGLSCMVCGFNFLETYGELGRGFIHVHHISPLSITGEHSVNPKTDLAILCPNCHSMIHREKSRVLTIDELKQHIKQKK